MNYVLIFLLPLLSNVLCIENDCIDGIDNVIHVDSYGEKLHVEVRNIVILVYDINMNPSCSEGKVNVVLPGYFHIISGEVINNHGYDLFKSGIVKASVALNDRDLCLDGSSTYVFIPNKFCRFKITSFVPSDMCLLLQQKGNHTLEEVEEKLNFNSKLELPPSPSFLGVELLSLLKGNYKIKITIFSEGEMIVQFTIPSNYTSIQMGL
ncbi:unnamed protein product [Auanema sp. JU1783]|nr:unnamed protein product [Auanema sp. JU1783]